jgi:hypothetical protein
MALFSANHLCNILLNDLIMFHICCLLLFSFYMYVSSLFIVVVPIFNLELFRFILESWRINLDMVHLELRISPRNFEQIRNGPNDILRGLGETDS